MKQKDSIFYNIQTAYGKFNIKFTVKYDSNNKPNEFYINIGSRDKKCVQLTVPAIDTQKTTAKLLWVESDENCSLERYIEKGLAQHMTLLGLTFVRLINKNIKTVTFEDTSSFKCDVPEEMGFLKTTEKIKEENKIQVPMKPFHIAFHNATWYEFYFGAMLEKDYQKYCELKKNMYKSEMKPANFNFINEQLQEELEPLYNESKNWHEFFQKIAKKYGKKKCAMIYPWITTAMNIIFDGFEIGTKWYIDFEENAKENKNKTPMIDINISTNLIRTEGGRKTRKNRPERRFTFSRTHLFPHIRKIQKWNYTDFLRGRSNRTN